MPKIKKLALVAICISFFISFICIYCKNESVKAIKENTALSVWQIDSFEGGKGSRADFLQNIGKEFNKKENCYITVMSLSAEAARLNLSKGIAPDIVSYGAGVYGLESIVTEFTAWCNGCYCLIALDTDCDFSDVNVENTVINRGKDNFVGVTALFCGLQGADIENPTAAYIQLINGKYKYLLGTQRDIFRLKTREVNFSIKPITEFNDLYQNISITGKCKNSEYARRYIDFLLSKKSELNKIGMFGNGVKLYVDEAGVCENLNFELKLTYPINETVKDDLEKYVSSGDINMIKKLLK